VADYNINVICFAVYILIYIIITSLLFLLLLLLLLFARVMYMYLFNRFHRKICRYKYQRLIHVA